MKTKVHGWAMVVFTLIIISVSGCALSVGDKGPEGSTQHVQPTLGKELIDLKSAWDQGAITEEEYQAHKKKLMKNQ